MIVYLWRDCAKGSERPYTYRVWDIFGQPGQLHDASFVFAALDKVLAWLKTLNGIQDLLLWSDNGPAHFKVLECSYDVLVILREKYRFQVRT